MSTLSRRKIFYVYAILDTRKPGPFYYGHWKFEYEPIYIGKGKGDRSVQHIWEAETNGRTYNVFKNRKIRKIQKSGLQPKIVVKRQGLTEKQALDLEIKLIRIVGRSNLNLGPLTNLSNGGEGVSGRVETDQSRENRSKARYNYIATSPKYEEDKAKALAGLRKARVDGRIKPRTWTDAQRAEVSKSSREAAIRYWTERPKAEIKADKLERSKRLAKLNRDSAGLVAKQRSAKAQATKKVKLDAMSPVSLIKHKKSVAKPLMDYVRNRTPKQLAAWTEKFKDTIASRTLDDRKRLSTKLSKSSVLRWSSMSLKDRARYTTNMVKKGAETRAKKTPAEQEASFKRRSEASKLRWAKLSARQRDALKMSMRKPKSVPVSDETRKVLSIAQSKRWANATKADRLAHSEAVSSARNNRGSNESNRRHVSIR